ncbi:MAG TPA: S41 family peptidase [Caldilineae bacterium]|nr:S41 family peptidase [Caldilineae bacterium]
MGENGLSRVLGWVTIGVLVLSMMGSAFVLGFGVGFGTGRWTAPDQAGASASRIAPAWGTTPLPTATPRPQERPDEDARVNRLPEEPEEFRVFWEAMQALREDYYGELPDDREMTYGAIRGVLELLGDENTTLLDPKSAEFFSSDLSGSFEGIGARVDLAPGGGVRVVEPFEGQPAYEAGIRRGDIIIKVDGQDITGMSLSEAIQLIRGPKGTTVRLTIKRPGEPELLEIKVVRDRIEIPVVEYKMLDDDIAYLKLSEFNSRSPELVRHALRELLRQKPKGLILDLRGNPGGLLDAAVEIASQFVGEGNILIERFKDGHERTYPARRGGLATEIPLVVLVNDGSASASEIVAGAIQDAGRGPLIGTTTFGKGSVQVPHYLSDGSLLRVTTALWFTPKGRDIEGKGLEPDIEVERTLEDRAAGRDPQLDKAVEYLLGLGIGE